jgi:thiol:disulfide interchange protein DsbD
VFHSRALLLTSLLAACTTREPSKLEAQRTATATPPRERAELVTVELSVLDDAARAQLSARLGLVGVDALVAVHHHIADGWHIYWRNPGDSGLRTRLDVAVSGATAGEVLFPAPERFVTAGQVTYGWGHEAVLFIPLTQVDERATITVDSHYLSCAESCIPGDAHVEARLAELPTRSDATTHEMLARVPEPARAHVNASWLDGALLVRPASEDLQIAELYPYQHDTALLGKQAPRDAGLELHYRFTGSPPTDDAAQGVLRVTQAGETRYLELAVAWPHR